MFQCIRHITLNQLTFATKWVSLKTNFTLQKYFCS